MYSVAIATGAEKGLRKLDRVAKNRVTTAIMALADDPRPSGCLKITSEPGFWRIRVGDYRIAYQIDDTALTVTIARVGHRSAFYDQ